MTSKAAREKWARDLVSLLEKKSDNKTDVINKAGIEWSPMPGSPQEMAYNIDCDETLFGGAAGSGKSQLLLGLAATKHFKSIIFRRNYTQLIGLINDSRRIIGDKGRYNGQEKIWRLNDGRTIEFGACANIGDEVAYQGRDHDALFMDELTHFAKEQYLFLQGWLRSANPNVRCRIVASSNPPTSPDGFWVKERWAAWLDAKHPNPAKPGELRWYVTINSEDTEVESGDEFYHQGELLIPRSRTFIPGKIQDNLYLAKSGYLGVLQSLPSPLREKMLYGDWEAGADDDEWQIIPSKWVIAAQERWRERITGGVQVSTGVDCARGGGDKSTIARYYSDHWVSEVIKVDAKNGVELAAKAIQATPYTVPICVDVCGIGASVYDSLIQMGREYIVPINSGEAATGLDKSGKLGFANLRSQMWWQMREYLDPDSGVGLCLPDSPEVLADLTSVRYKFTSWRVQAERKEEIKKRLGRSPDVGEAILYAICGINLQPMWNQGIATWSV